MLMRNSDAPEPPPPGMMPPGSENKIMHAEIRIGGVGADGLRRPLRGGREVRRLRRLPAGARRGARPARFFVALSDGGEVRMPLGPTFFSPAFGMVQDRFGVLWMIGVFEDGA